MRRLAKLAILIFVAQTAMTARGGEEPSEAARAAQDDILRARMAAGNGKYDDAIWHATDAIQLDPKSVEALLLRGELYAAQRKHELAIADLDQIIKLDSKHAQAYDKRGEERFKVGRFKESVEDFDKAIELGARREREHWQRGISHYYAGQFEKGQKQFEAYQTFEDNDVENAVWRYLCMAKRVGGKKGAERAQDDLLKIRRDMRVPMMEVYDLYAGKLKPDDVLAAVKVGEPKPAILNERLFYAHLYLGLYYDAAGDAKLAAKHMDEAVGHKIGHYMWDVAKVHAEVLKNKSKTKTKE